MQNAILGLSRDKSALGSNIVIPLPEWGMKNSSDLPVKINSNANVSADTDFINGAIESYDWAGDAVTSKNHNHMDHSAAEVADRESH